MSKTLWSMLMKCLKPSSHQDPSMRTSMCGTSLFRRWSSRSPSLIRAGSPAWPGCPLTSWLLLGMIMQSWLGISLARLWSYNDGWWWWRCMMTVCSLHGDSSDHDDHHEMRWEMRCDNDDRWMDVIICNLKYISYAYPSWLSSSSSSCILSWWTMDE